MTAQACALIRGAFHEEPPADYEQFLCRYAEAIYFLQYQAEQTAFAVIKMLTGDKQNG